MDEELACLEQVEKEVSERCSRVLYSVSVISEPEFVERTQWCDRLPPLAAGHHAERDKTKLGILMTLWKAQI